MKKLNYRLLFVLCFFAACDKSNEIKDPVPVEDVSEIARMTSDFGWKLFHEVASGVTDENVLISPLSVQTALSMAANGANGLTLEEILTVIGCNNCDVKDLNKQTAQLRILMEDQSGHPRLVSANGFFYDPDRVDVRESFIQILTDDYRAGFEEHNFNDPATVDKINNWVKENTAGKIDKIIDEIDGLDLAFLINALHFKSDWATGFNPDETYPDIFTTGENTPLIVSYVSADRNFSSAQRQNFNMVDLPFKDSTYTFSLVQPVDAIADQLNWVLQLTSTELKDMWTNLSYGRAYVRFPKLDIEYEEELKDPLERLGIIDAFSEGKANFSNLGTALIGPVIYISKVRHKAVLKVDEKGAEGAAVTSVGFSTTSAPPQFSFDKPFVIVLRHTVTNTILFAGLINDPS
jgi:serpin B